MPKTTDPAIAAIDPSAPKRTKAERQAAKTARQTAHPLRDNPGKGKAKGQRLDKTVKRKAADEGVVEATPAPDGTWRITGVLDPDNTASNWIILPPADTP